MDGGLFEGYDDAKAALLESIIKEFENNKKFGPEIKDKATQLLKSVDWMRILGLGFKHIALPAAQAYLTGGVSLIPFLAEKLTNVKADELTEKLKGDHSEEFLRSLIKNLPEENRSMLIRDFRDDFQELVKASKISKLVVVIDDLDRCTPDRIIENIEAIKLFLNVEHTAFVIGADPRIVRHAIHHRFNKEDVEATSNTRIVDDYLEKLIQIPYYLPKLSDSEVETYISLLVCKRELTKESFEKVLSTFHQFRNKNRYSVFGLADIKNIVDGGEYDSLTNSLGSLPALASIITQSLYGNPRQIKRFLNTFTLRRRLAAIATISGFDETILAKLMILEYTELPLFKQLYEWQSSQEGRPEQIRELEEICANGTEDEAKKNFADLYRNWAKDKVIKWLKVEPALIDVDLRDYFWLSRDNISSTISGTSLIPPIVKLIYQKLNQENLPATAAKKIINSEVKRLNENELGQFLEFAINVLNRNQENIQGYKIFHYMIEENVSDSAAAYKRLLNTIDKKKIPPAVGTDLKGFKEHGILGDFLHNIFSESKSKAAKAFNL